MSRAEFPDGYSAGPSHEYSRGEFQMPKGITVYVRPVGADTPVPVE